MGWVAVISGRNREFLADRMSGVLAIGSYGLELPPELSASGLPEGFPAAEVRRRLGAARDELEEKLAELPGTRLEVKPWGVALHFRGAGPGFDRDQAKRVTAQVALRHDLTVQEGRLVDDLKPREAVDKGWALRLLTERLEPSAVMFVGDDLGDQPAWEAARDLDLPSLAVGIASTELPPAALEACDLVLQTRDELVGLVTALTAAAHRPGG